jgi:hypothetical protein
VEKNEKKLKPEFFQNHPTQGGFFLEEILFKGGAWNNSFLSQPISSY